MSQKFCTSFRSEVRTISNINDRAFFSCTKKVRRGPKCVCLYECYLDHSGANQNMLIYLQLKSWSLINSRKLASSHSLYFGSEYTFKFDEFCMLPLNIYINQFIFVSFAKWFFNCSVRGRFTPVNLSSTSTFRYGMKLKLGTFWKLLRIW